MIVDEGKEKERTAFRKEKMEMTELKKENLELRGLIEKSNLFPILIFLLNFNSLRVQLNLKIEDEEELKRLRESYNPDRLFELESLLREYENKIALLTL